MIRVLSIVEADTVTGPVKNLLEFGRLAKRLPEASRTELTIARYQRGISRRMSELGEAAESAGIVVHEIREGFPYDPGVISRLRRLVDDLRPDIVQTHSVKSHFLIRLSGLWKRYPWVAYHHGYTRPDRKMEFINSLDRWSLRRARRVVTVTKAFEQELLASGVVPDQISIAHNAISPDWGHRDSVDRMRVRDIRAGLGQARLLLSVGRLSREKAHADLLRSLTHLLRRRPDLLWKVVIVGEGPERSRLESQAMSMQGRVLLVGQQSDIEPYYAAADVFVLPSHSEGSPNVLLEAMAARVPIVATSVGGVPEIVSSGEHALLVPASDIEALAAAIERLLDQPEVGTALARRATARVASVYSPEARAEQLAGVYAEIAAEMPRRT